MQIPASPYEKPKMIVSKINKIMVKIYVRSLFKIIFKRMKKASPTATVFISRAVSSKLELNRKKLKSFCSQSEYEP